jgi:hypothetical protein
MKETSYFRIKKEKCKNKFVNKKIEETQNGIPFDNVTLITVT